MLLRSRHKAIAFDLDGTLCDSCTGILAAYRAAFGDALGDDYLRSCIGTPLRETISRHISGETEQREAWDRFHSYYDELGWTASQCYAGIPELLGTLQDADVELVVVTNKLEHYARRIIEQNGLSPYFSSVSGLRDGLSSKRDLLERWLGATTAPRTACLMVGDSSADIDAAAAVGIPAIWVSYGYGVLSAEEQLPLLGAASSVTALRKLLLPDC